MEQELISKLKIKPKPKSIESFEILLKQPESAKYTDIKIKTVIIDKTKTANIDRNAFLQNLNLDVKSKSLVHKDLRLSDKKLEEKEDIGKDDIDKKDAKKKSKKDLHDDALKKEILDAPMIINIKFTGQKFIIVKENIEVGIDAAIDTTEYTKKRITPKPAEKSLEGPESLLQLKDAQILLNKIPESSDKLIIRSSNYYMNNREIFINFINSLFEPYKQKLLLEDSDPDNPNLSCNKTSSDFKALTHQKIVRDYINIYTPYRGLLLFHGLGSGKTCSSIGIAEGLKNHMPVIIMTPASLRANYIEELKKCGDLIYKKTQFWEFLNTTTNPDLALTLSRILNIDIEYINLNGGVWFVDSKKKANYDTLSGKQQKSINEQLNKMIEAKYQFINYNGMRLSHLTALTRNFTINPFTNKVIIIDEAHNFISRIINKLTRPNTLSMKLYDYLMDAENCKIVFLSGTPIINYPNEISIMFNMLRGYIYTYYFKLKILSGKVDQTTIQKIFQKPLKPSSEDVSTVADYLDYIDYKPSTNILIVTKNPFNFKTKFESENYNGVYYEGETGMTHDDFIDLIKQTLISNNIEIEEDSIKIEQHKALPDKYDDFKDYFIDSNNNVKNVELLKHRIIGLTSYFPDIVQLLPKYVKSQDFTVVKIEMSDFQFGVYEEARVQERKLEQSNKKKETTNRRCL